MVSRQVRGCSSSEGNLSTSEYRLVHDASLGFPRSDLRVSRNVCFGCSSFQGSLLVYKCPDVDVIAHLSKSMLPVCVRQNAASGV